MRIIENEIYQNDLRAVATLALDWDQLQDTTIMISGATGMIGSFLIDVIMYRNKEYEQNCMIYALGRDPDKALKRFTEYWEDHNFKFLQIDLAEDICFAEVEKVDYIFHAASTTHPVAYATDPIGTMVANIIGLNNLLAFASKHSVKRFLFASSNEIYGENRGDTHSFSEEYCGYIDCNTLRAGYPESKRAGEALCQAYIRQKKIDVVIPRMTRSYGPTMLMSDTKAISQFIKKGIASEDIVLKSAGTQLYSYTYVADAVSGVLTCLFDGKCGEAYNIADETGDITLRDLAATISDYVGTKVVFDLPDADEQAGYSKVTQALLDSKKLQSLGWKARFSMKTGLEHTIEILKNL